MSEHPVTKIGIREAVRLAEDHALGILDSADDGSFWGDDFIDEHADARSTSVLIKAKRIVMNRIRRTR